MGAHALHLSQDLINRCPWLQHTTQHSAPFPTRVVVGEEGGGFERAECSWTLQPQASLAQQAHQQQTNENDGQGGP